jgi:two-component system chemotaxis sensor kinase CheA
MNDVTREFLLETHENLAQLDTDLIALEKDPTERQTLARVFRTLHSVKGTAGFVGLPKLQAVAHSAESLLSRLRAGELAFNRPIASAVLGVVDAIRQILASVEADKGEGPDDYTALIARLDRLRETGGEAPAPVVPPTDTSQLPAVNLWGNGPSSAAPPKPLPPKADPATPPSPAADKPAGAAVVPVTASATIIAPPAEPAPQESTEPRASVVSDSSIRVDVGLLDKLMNLVGELVLARNQIVQFSTSQDDVGFLGTVQRFNLLTTELQANVMKTRMQPIGNVWGKFPRVVRDLSVACGKQVRFETEGQETELDKTIIETIRDPLTHMVRNAVDHGIEPPDVRAGRGKPAEGRLALHAFHEGGKVIIEIADDGAGIDPQRVREKAIRSKAVSAEDAARMSERELLNLIFLPGFSTADRVTQFSGRGVGMDVVRTNIEKIGGMVDVESRLGRGTTVKMKIPLTLAIIPALTVATGRERFCIPQVNLLELVRLEAEQAQRGIEQIHGAPVYRLRGNLLPLVYLDERLQIDSSRRDGEINIVVLQADDRQFGLVVDAIHDTEEIVVKPLQKQLKGVAAFAGATIMGDGRVALILDVVGLAQMANVVSGARGRALTEKAPAAGEESAADRQSLLLFATTDGRRMAVPLAQVARLEEFPRSSLEHVGACDVVQYRGEILPLLDVARELRRLARGDRSHGRPNATGHARPPGRPAGGATCDTLPVVVCAGGGRRVGLMVASILDIVEEEVVTRSATNRPGVLFTAVVQGRVTEFLDVSGILGSTAPLSHREPAGAGHAE